MIKNITDELRALAERSTRLACECSNTELSHALEELAVELMARAAELERRFDR
jgi:hypothetical protein